MPLFVVFGGAVDIFAMDFHVGGLAMSPNAVGENDAKNKSRAQPDKHMKHNPGSIADDGGDKFETSWFGGDGHRLETAVLIGRNQAVSQQVPGSDSDQEKDSPQNKVVEK